MIIRQYRNIKQSRLAYMMRTTQATVSEMERGQTDPKISRIRSYANALGLTLLLGDEQPFPDLAEMSVRDLMDLYCLMGEEIERRLSSQTIWRIP